jgi:CRP-like cAMP-binding protein
MIEIMSDTIESLFRGAIPQDMPRDALLFRANDAVRSMFRVEAGRIDLVRHGADGGRMILHRARAGKILAEASAYSAAYHCDGVVVEDSRVAVVPMLEFQSRLAADPVLAAAWSACLARALQRSRANAEIRTMRTVAMRLDAWLGDGGVMPDRGQWQRVAEEIGVSREALYRELAKRG